jgi:hypothetical protein
MKKTMLVLLSSIALSGCGYTSRDGEAIGQAKKVTAVTPLLCGDYYALDVSLGVMRGGVGSMSTQDMWLTIRNVGDIAKMKAAVESGAIVRIKYDTPRFPICTESFVLTGFEVTQ